jgi:hypothetical protein
LLIILIQTFVICLLYSFEVACNVFDVCVHVSSLYPRISCAIYFYIYILMKIHLLLFGRLCFKSLNDIVQLYLIFVRVLTLYYVIVMSCLCNCKLQHRVDMCFANDKVKTFATAFPLVIPLFYVPKCNLLCFVILLFVLLCFVLFCWFALLIASCNYCAHLHIWHCVLYVSFHGLCLAIAIKKFFFIVYLIIITIISIIIIIIIKQPLIVCFN